MPNTTEDWSWFEATQVPVYRRGRVDGWLSTMPLSCPHCMLPWSDEGLYPIRGHSQRGWGSPPYPPHSKVYYECAECQHRAFQWN